MAPLSDPKNKKIYKQYAYFGCKCVFLVVFRIFFGVILQNFPGGMLPDPPTIVVLKLICDVTLLCDETWPSPRESSAYATAENNTFLHLQ